jgi:hypothetical protein
MSDVTGYSVFTGIKHRIECLMSVYSVFTGIKLFNSCKYRVTCNIRHSILCLIPVNTD